MASKVRMDLSIPVSEATFKARVRPMNSDSRRSFNGLGNYMSALAGDPYIGSMHMITGAVQATGLLTVSSTGPTNGQTATVANVTLTAETSGADPTLGQFNINASATTVATGIALAINSTPALSGIVTATSALGVVTITAVAPGTIGNGLDLTEAMTNVAKTAFASGADGTTYTFANGYVAP